MRLKNERNMTYKNLQMNYFQLQTGDISQGFLLEIREQMHIFMKEMEGFKQKYFYELYVGMIVSINLPESKQKINLMLAT